ncbi:MAG: PleD family two-component system response regulator [Hyphomicrobiaceae bacterium]
MKHCLIVDDSEVIRKVARRILESLHIDVTEAGSGEEAVERCRERMPDAVLLDWQMPDMSGLEFLGALRLATKAPRPHIIYCITENDSSEIARAFLGGANDYLLKPYDRESLSAKLGAAGIH